NANPLSAAAGVATLALVATGEPGQHANEMGRLFRQKLNALFAEGGHHWIAYGEVSGFKVLPHYPGPRPTGDDFTPYDGNPDKLEAIRLPQLTHAFRRAMLLNGVDLPGMWGMTTAAHTADDIHHTVKAVGSAVEMLREEGM